MTLNGSTNIKPISPKQNKKKKGRFNFVDLTLIIILILIVGVLAYSFSPVSLIKKWINKETVNIQYEVELVGVDKNVVDLIKSNMVVTDSVTKGTIGTVTMDPKQTGYVEYKPVETIRYEVDGDEQKEIVEYSVEKITYENKYNLNVIITVAADYNEGVGYSVGSTRIAVGEKLALKFPDYKCEAYCVGITPEY